MGQQQLLILMLGAIIVGIAIAAGLLTFQASSVNSARDALINDINVLASNAQQYYLRPESLAGGGGSFVGYRIPERLRENGNGTYSVGEGSDQSLTLEGVSALYPDIIVKLTLGFADDGWNYEWDWEHEGL